MSAWGIGSTNMMRRRGRIQRSGGEEPAQQPVPSLDTVITWIPGEVIAAYAAVVLALQPTAEDNALLPLEITSGWWLIAGMAFAAVLTWLGAFSKTDDLAGAEARELVARVGLAAVAFAIWSVVVPGSWWYSVDAIADNPALVPIIVGLVGVAFGLAAEGVVRRIGS